MAGEAKSSAFMLGTATVMIGAMADLMTLNDAHSVGLVKNITVKTEPGFTDLTQGVKNSLVYSVMTKNDAMVSGEMYEYTSKNLAYQAGLDGASVTPTAAATTLTTAVAAPTGQSTEGAKVLVVGDVTAYQAGDTIFVQPPGTENVMVRKVASVDNTSKTITVDRGLPFALPVGTIIREVNVIALGSTSDQPYLSCKIVGTMANGDLVSILIPKVRLTAGLSLGFKTDNYDNMPIELKIFDQVTTDPFYTTFQSVGPAGKPAKAMLLVAG